MPTSQPFHVSEAPTHPHPRQPVKTFDVADLYQGPVAEVSAGEAVAVPLDEKLRQAYFWIVNHAIISPHYDIEYDDEASQTFSRQDKTKRDPPTVEFDDWHNDLDETEPVKTVQNTTKGGTAKKTTPGIVSYVFGDMKTKVHLPSAQSYSSFVLLPLLNFAVRRRCLLVGGPGRGKTSSAILLGLLAGYSLKEIRQAIQHGQPQMTISDLLGNPLPADLVAAQSFDDIRIAWRKWLGMRVKIIDEYNRIPTRTQSALLTVMADNYAEILDHVYECPPAAWFLTANDEAGGGTYQVIEALRDRIDIVVKALPFNMRFLGVLLERIEYGVRPEEVVPAQITFSAGEMAQMENEALAVEFPREVRRRLEFFASQFEFFEPAGDQLEYKTKDTVKLAGADYHQLSAQETGKDKLKDLGAQTLNGLSVRALMTVLAFAKALAYFRGNPAVSLEDLRQIVPFVLHDKLAPDLDAAFFEAPGNGVFRIDRIGWIRKLFDLSCAEYDRLNLDRDDPVGDLNEEFALGLERLTQAEVRARLTKIERLLTDWSKGRKFYGHLYDDVLNLKYLHQRYTNYLQWLKWKE